MRRIFLCLLLVFLMSESFSQYSDVFNSISTFVRSRDLVIGFAARDMETGITVMYNEHEFFPMQSVYKFHLALYVYDLVDRGKLSPDQNIFVGKSDLLPDTWSPLRDMYSSGNISLPLKELLKYTVSESDNNACDILFRLVGGPGKVQKFINRSGIMDVNIVSDEAHMHRTWDEQYKNRTTPLSALHLLSSFHTGKLLKSDSYVSLLTMMTETTTGMSRIRGLLPSDVIVSHKTGTGGVGPDGKISAVNDIGLITFTDGSTIAIAVFIKDSKLQYEENERIIAELAIYISWFFGKISE
jgi:beta-lactamase class A